MGLRKGFMFLLLLAIGLICTDARSLEIYDTIVLPADQKGGIESKVQAVRGNEQLCSLCEEYTAIAVDYLSKNKTETEIIDTLHQACSRLLSLEQQCVVLVDYYASLFFMEINKIKPEEFCTKVNLCEKMSLVSLTKSDDTCTLCHRVVTEILTKLSDPDSQLEIIQMLLKECTKMDNYAKECKRLVFRYGPLILAKGEKFLESKDICTTVRACTANQGDGSPAILPQSSLLEA